MILNAATNSAAEKELPLTSDMATCDPLLYGDETQEHIDKLLQDGLNDLGYSNFRSGQVTII